MVNSEHIIINHIQGSREVKLKAACTCVLFSAAVFYHPFIKAADNLAIEQMAEIILQMESKPTEEHKLTLEDIANDNASTNVERSLAKSIISIEGKVRPENKPEVTKVWTNPAASEEERSIAKAILRFDETIDNKTKEMLGQLVK